MKVVILAGGFGTRLSEYTKTIPKPMIDIAGKPMLIHIMKFYAKYGFKEFDTAPNYGNGFSEFILGKIFYNQKDVVFNNNEYCLSNSRKFII